MSPTNVTNQPAYFRHGDPEKESEPVAPYPGFLGTRVTLKGKTWQYVRTDSTMSTAPFKHAVAWWANKATFLVTTSPTALGRGMVAGRFPDNGAGGSITKGHYGYIQTKGIGRIKFVAAVTAQPTAAGLVVIPSAEAGKADCLAAGAAATYPALGRSAGVYDAAACECDVDLNVPETP